MTKKDLLRNVVKEKLVAVTDKCKKSLIRKKVRKDCYGYTISNKVYWFNRLFVCPFCACSCKGEVTLALRYRATASKHRNILICGARI